MFVCLEGIDGAGKSTQAKLLTEYLIDHGVPAELVFDPGTTKLGLAIRQLILDCDDPISPNAQMLLFSSARAELSEHIRKQRRANKIIICDRWLLSTLVYQSALNGVDPKLVVEVFEQTSLSPDLCVLLDLDPADADRRKQHELRKDRFERVSLEQKNMMRRAYLDFSQEPACGKHVHVIDANQPEPAVLSAILGAFFAVRETLSAQMKGITCGL